MKVISPHEGLGLAAIRCDARRAEVISPHEGLGPFCEPPSRPAACRVISPHEGLGPCSPVRCGGLKDRDLPP